MENLDGLIEDIAEVVWGKPSRQTSDELRYGSHGSKCVDRKNKVWFDHETGEGGGVITLIQQKVGMEPGAVRISSRALPEARWNMCRSMKI